MRDFVFGNCKLLTKREKIGYQNKHCKGCYKVLSIRFASLDHYGRKKAKEKEKGYVENQIRSDGYALCEFILFFHFVTCP